MAVYTTIEKEELEAFIKPFCIGPLVEFEGVCAGINNTNYFITTDQSDFPSEMHTESLRRYVLTIFEHSDINELAFYIKLTRLLSQREQPVPCAINDADGVALHHIQGKPALLVPKIEGQHTDRPNEQQCLELGRAMANIHTVCLDSKLEHHNQKDFTWLENISNELKPVIEKTDQWLFDEIPRLIDLINTHCNLPQAIIHGCLVKESAIFRGNQLVALINFNNAGSGFLMLDLATTVNDWCSQADGNLNKTLEGAFLRAYSSIRTISNDERLLWNDFLRIAAMQTWLSRLADQMRSESRNQSGWLIERRDPLHYKNILIKRIQSPE